MRTVFVFDTVTSYSPRLRRLSIRNSEENHENLIRSIVDDLPLHRAFRLVQFSQLQTKFFDYT